MTDRLRSAHQAMVKSISRAAMLSVWASLVCSPTSFSNEIRTRQELEQLDHNIELLREKLTTDQSEQQKISDEIEKMEQQGVELTRSYEQQLSQLHGLESTKKQLAQQQHQLMLDRQKETEELLDMVKSNYLLARQDSIRLILSQKEPSDMVRVLAMYRYFIESRNEKSTVSANSQSNINELHRNSQPNSRKLMIPSHKLALIKESSKKMS